mgnify:CR=1
APENFPFCYGCWKECFWWNHGYKIGNGLNIKCLSISADGINNHDLPTIAKVRYIDKPYGSILAPLEYG